MATLDSSIVNVSVPVIMSNFGVNIDDIEWIMTGYMLAFATFMPLTGWVRERIGYKKTYIAALFLFTLGSVLCGFAWNLPSLIFARVIQAFGGGALTPTGMSMVMEVFPPKERGKALGFWGVAIITGPAIGPTLGGYLTNDFGWRSIFLVNLPVGALGMMMAAEMLLKDMQHKMKKKPFDFWGFAFFSIFLVSFLLGMSKGEREGWTSHYILTCIALSALSFVGFLLVELHVQNRIIDLSLFKIPVFSIAIFITIVRSIGLFGSTFLIPLFVQQQLGYSTMQSGLLMLPAAVFMAVLLPFMGNMADKIGPKIPAVIGLSILAYSLFIYRRIDLMTSAWGLIWPMMVRSVGLALLMAPINTTLMNSVPHEKIGMSSSMNNIFMQIGSSLGIAFFGTSLSHRAVYHISVVSQSIRTNNIVSGAVIERLAHHIHGAGYTYVQSAVMAHSVLSQTIIQGAMVMSYQDTFIIGGMIVLIAIPASFILPMKAVHHPHKESGENQMVAME
jgi:DHA2 family multidrug resistance protein